jgi:undecaprenyl-diphosphatase
MTEPAPPKGVGKRAFLRWAVYAGCVVGFSLLAVSARGPEGLFCDMAFIDSAHAISGPTLTAGVRAITTLGNASTLTAIVILTTLVLFLAKDRRSAWFVLATGIGTSTLNDLLKLAFARPRPDEMWRMAHASGYSFPSGHAMASASIYGAIALVLCTLFPRLRLPIAITTIALVFAIGASRVYLCVHYSSDVMAGWIVGSVLPFLFWPLFGVERAHRARIAALTGGDP